MNADKTNADRTNARFSSAFIGVHRRLMWSADCGRKPEDDTLPLDFGLLEIDEYTKSPAGGSQIVETLGGVFVSQALDTFQFHHQHVFDKYIGKVFSNGVALVGYCE